MGRSTPDRPRGARPDFNPPGQGTTTPRRVRCDYCGRGGVELTQCEGCGASVPAASSRPIPRPTFPANRNVKAMSAIAMINEALDAFDREVDYPVAPTFDKVRR